MLKTEHNTQSIERQVRSAAHAILRIKTKNLRTFFEHGQWWAEDADSGAQWSVVDAEGGRAVNGFDFEQVTYGEEE